MADLSYGEVNYSTHNGSLKGDEVVISGISGIYPASDNVREFMNNLYDKIDMVTKVDEYDNIKHSEMPKHLGKINGFSKFDAQFFRVTHWQASSMDPVTRKMMEHTFSAIFDSGINPLSLSGTKLGVFIGSSYSDIIAYNLYNLLEKNIFVLSGCSKTMMSNRISYWIDAKGPSYSIDQASASTYACLEIACRSIKSGECDAAIVGGGIRVIDPILSLNLRNAGLTCVDGKTKCFDKNGDGYVRSEAISVMFIQRARDAKRIYTEICHVKDKYFTKPDANFLPIREPEDVQNFLEEFYLEAKVCPDEVEYVEASGSGIAEADGKELQAIGQFFGRNKPIKVGSVNSNIGNTEAASCACALTKICAAYHKGILPANLHYTNPQDHIPAVRDGNVQILTENTNFNRGYSAINHFSFTGPNYHVLLKGHYKAKKNYRMKTTIPYIVPVSGRQDACVNKILNTLNETSVDVEQIALLHNIFQNNIPGHTGRGYVLLDTNENKETINLGQKFEWNSSGDTREVWFLYSGMGSQWPTMGLDLMRIPIFAAAIERCDRLLKSKGLNLMKIITDPDGKIFDNIVHSFVGITAIQIGLTDILKALGIVPNNIIGHSVGELGCAYADGCITIEETILASYNRGVVARDTKLIPGSMAAVGLGYKDVKNLCPPGIEVACHNSSKSCTLSGPAEVMKNFLAELTAHEVFAKEVPTSNIAFHSKFIADMGPSLLSLMRETILDPKPRSNKWISTSVPQENWESAKYASPEYFTNNLLNPVYFEEASALIPNNAIIIEIAPHGLLQAIMKQSLTECTYIPLTKRKHVNPVNFLLEAIGRIYLSGLNPKVSALYPEVEFPVATETPILSDLVEWDHSETWTKNEYNSETKQIIAAKEYIISIDDEEYSYLRGHVRDGLNVLPETAILVFVWKTFAMFLGLDNNKTSVKFENVKFYKELIINNKEPIRLHVTINRGKQIFEVTQEEKQISTGIIKIDVPDTDKGVKLHIANCEAFIDQNNVYTCLTSRGYNYSDEFKSIYSSNISRNKALIQWTGNWVTFLDGIIQLNLLKNNYEGVSVPKFINKLIIDVNKHVVSNQTINNDSIYYEAESCNDIFEVTRCGGVLMKSIVYRNIQKRHIEEYYNLPDDVMKSIQNVKLTVPKKGCLNSLRWEEGPNLKDNHHLVQISYAGLSLRDYENIINNDSVNTKYFGMDFSGYNCRGEKVMGVIREGAIGNTVNPDLDLLWPVPEHWSLVDAATVPLPYLHAYYCLALRGNLLRNQRVFITGGAGALAQAVISICISMNCTIYTTVNSVEKKVFLLKLFPELQETNIGYSRDPEIRNIISTTKDKRCHIVINCCSGILRKAAMDCVCLYGTFLDLNRYDMLENEDFGMFYLEEDRVYKHVNISEIFKEENLNDKILLQKMISEGIASGAVRPLSRVSYSPEDIQRAFGLLSHSKHRGRVLIQMEKLDLSKLNIQPRVHLSPTSVYVVICEKSVQCIELIDYFARRGAKKFSVHITDNFIGYLQAKLITWTADGIDVVTHFGKIREIDDCRNLLHKSKTMGPVEGIFILHDETDSLNREINNETIIENFDIASREICKELRYFVVLDASTRNQDNDYVAKKVCDAREKLGLHAAVVYKQNHFELTPDKTNIKDFIGIKSLLYNLEIILRFKNIEIEKTLKSESKRQNEITYLKELSTILGDNVIKGSSEELSLKELNLLETKYEEIKTLVKETYLINFLTEELKEMTIASLINLGKRFKKSHASIRTGLEAFFTYIDEDIASEPIITMKTKYTHSNEKEEEVNPNEPHLIMLPGYEGQHRIFKTIAECLKVRAIIVQFDSEAKEDTIQSMAAKILKNLKKRIKFESKFYLFGYSFGVNVALELAALLEREGYIGVVFCLDSSPDALRVQTQAYLGNLNDNKFENAILTHVYKMTTGRDEEEITTRLMECQSWVQKVNTFISLIRGVVSYSHQYLKDVVEAMYRRLKIAQTYNPDIRLQSELILIKGVAHPKATELTFDYNLCKYTEQRIKIFNIDSDHTSVLQDYRVASIVNSMLDLNILKEYESKNRCEFYFKF